MTDHDDLAGRVGWLETEFGELQRIAASERSVQMLRDRIIAQDALIAQLGARLAQVERIASSDFA